MDQIYQDLPASLTSSLGYSVGVDDTDLQRAAEAVMRVVGELAVVDSDYDLISRTHKALQEMFPTSQAAELGNAVSEAYLLILERIKAPVAA